MRGLIIVSGLGAAVALVAVASLARAQEEKVDLSKVPKPVLEAVKARFKDAKVTDSSKETEKGKVVYEVTIKDKGQTIDVTVTPEGEIIMIEKEIAAKDLPKAVSKAIEEKYPKSDYKIIEEIFTVEKKLEKLVYYEVLLQTSNKEFYEVQVTAEGKIVNVEKKKSAKD